MYNDLYNTTKGILIKGINSDTAFICKFNGPKCKVTAFSDQYYRCHTHVNGKRVIITKTGDELVLS
jgi:hypothetical protein